jgi:hypothetical protein
LPPVVVEAVARARLEPAVPVVPVVEPRASTVRLLAMETAVVAQQVVLAVAVA